MIYLFNILFLATIVGIHEHLKAKSCKRRILMLLNFSGSPMHTMLFHELIDMSYGSIYVTLEKLEQDGFVEIERRHYDGRDRNFYSLSAKGAEEVKKIW